LSDDSAAAEILVVCGPTAAGKSAAAMWIAQRHAFIIVSADSRQVYRGFDVGTAKPTPEERAIVPHVGIDLCQPAERYSAAAWASAADTWIDGIHRAGKRPLVVGGTGLYLRALFEGLFEEPELDLEQRRRVENIIGALSVDELRRWTNALDPARAQLGRTQLLRSVEIALLTGRRLSELHRERPRTPRWRARYLLVDPGAALAQRIECRIDAMLDHGWPDEVHRLMQTIPPEAPAWNATGYGAVRAMIRGELTRAAARERIVISTRQYAKRQRTWFRNQLPPAAVTHLDSTAGDWQSVIDAWSA
jgi:tRNA dimethylallyltransferase